MGGYRDDAEQQSTNISVMSLLASAALGRATSYQNEEEAPTRNGERRQCSAIRLLDTQIDHRVDVDARDVESMWRADGGHAFVA